MGLKFIVRNVPINKLVLLMSKLPDWNFSNTKDGWKKEDVWVVGYSLLDLVDEDIDVDDADALIVDELHFDLLNFNKDYLIE